ncbi:PfkB family carbohydrate kinase [Plastoroseomonas arctica]|uniref:Sugar kinase n=1 Tax=Plastoroseomonas arctica TaxID=1509237 RepID=A0AAF1KJM0_9PROT|nr:PfkB family carbohydrate kinase [Plastoroseomonas arctica]MBR0655440.1 sugar kinase [Plastoroseomonas arctica]
MTKSLPPLVICLGNVVADHVFRVDEVPQPPAKARARGYKLTVGGMAANAAIAVKRLGGRSAFWGRVGDDSNATLLTEQLGVEGIDLTGMHAVAGARSPVSAVLVDRYGERAIMGFRGEGLGTDPSWLPLGMLREARGFLCDPRWPEGAHVALEAAEKLDIPTVLDGERSETRLLLDLVPRVRYAIFSAPGLNNFAPGQRPAEALRRAVSEGVTRMAAVTRGEKSTLWLRRGETRPREMMAFRIEPRDTTGAGDVFHGAFALGMAEGMDEEAALRFGSAAGALRARDGATAHRAETDGFIADRAEG